MREAFGAKADEYFHAWAIASYVDAVAIAGKAVKGRHGIGFSPFGMDATGFANYPLGTVTLDAATIYAFAADYRLFRPMDRVWAKLAYEGRTWG